MNRTISPGLRAAFLTALISLSISAAAFGQSSFAIGLKGGGNSNVFWGVDRPEGEPAFRGHGGLYMRYFFTKHFGLEAEGMYLGSGYEGNPNLEEVFFLDYGMGGLLAYFRFEPTGRNGVYTRLYAGGYYAKLARAQRSVFGDLNDATDEFSSFDFGGRVGGNAAWTRGIFEFQFELGLAVGAVAIEKAYAPPPPAPIERPQTRNLIFWLGFGCGLHFGG